MKPNTQSRKPIDHCKAIAPVLLAYCKSIAGFIALLELKY